MPHLTLDILTGGVEEWERPHGGNNTPPNRMLKPGWSTTEPLLLFLCELRWRVSSQMQGLGLTGTLGRG